LVESEGLLTGELEGLNVRKAEKVARLQEWLGAEGVGAGKEEIELWAYGNSGNDRPLLVLADHPTWVGPARVLRRRASS
jgi:phosphoserine phosphatase